MHRHGLKDGARDAKGKCAGSPRETVASLAWTSLMGPASIVGDGKEQDPGISGIKGCVVLRDILDFSCSYCQIIRERRL